MKTASINGYTVKRTGNPKDELGIYVGKNLVLTTNDPRISAIAEKLKISKETVLHSLCDVKVIGTSAANNKCVVKCDFEKFDAVIFVGGKPFDKFPIFNSCDEFVGIEYQFGLAVERANKISDGIANKKHFYRKYWEE